MSQPNSRIRFATSERDICVNMALAAGLTDEEAKKACSTCSSSKPLYDVAVKENSKLGTVPLGARSNPDDDPIAVIKEFIDYRLKQGDSLEVAQQRSIGIKRFLCETPRGSLIYYSHDAQGASEYDDSTTPAKPVESAQEKALHKVLELRRIFGDSEQEAYTHASEITDEQPINEAARELQTPVASKLLADIANGADDFTLIQDMATWQVDHEKVEVKQLNAKQQHNHDFGDAKLTVGSSYGLSETEKTKWLRGDASHPIFRDFENKVESTGVNIVRNEEFPRSNRESVGSSYGMTEQEKAKWLRGKTREQILEDSEK